MSVRVSELVNCFTGYVACGIILVRILDSVPEHFITEEGSSVATDPTHIPEESFDNYVLMSS